MAVTFFQQPTGTTIQATDNPILFVFSGSNYLQPNFSFIVQTVIDNIVVSTDMIFPERGGRAHFDIMKTTLAQFKAAARAMTNPPLYALQNFSTAEIRVAERYGATPFTYGFTSSNNFRLMKARCSDEDFEANWITINYPASSKWLTDVPDNVYIGGRNNSAWFSILNSDVNIIIGITLYDADDNPIYVDSYNLGTTADRVNIVVNPYTLAPVLLAASLTLDDVFMVEIQMNSADSIYVRFVVDECELNASISWLNHLGAYDQMRFAHNRESKEQLITREYKKQFGAWTANGLSFVYDPLTTGDTIYMKEIAPTGSLYTAWLSESYRNWLNGIVRSVDVILMIDAQYEKIVVTNASTDELKEKYEEIMQYQIDYRKTNYKSVTQ